MNRLIVLALLLSASCSPSNAAEDTSFSAKARALDGDTVATDFRLLGVDAFEASVMRTRRCLLGMRESRAGSRRAHLGGGDAQIILSSHSSYGRPVATVSIDGRDLGEVMISAGLAIPQPQYLRSDPARSARYTAAFTEAQRQRAGAFAGSWLEPARWRRGERLTCKR
jgi:endonuclease YncB( thermonuclease family)